MKKQHDHKVDELFSKSLGGLTKEPGDKVWLNIKSQLPAGTGLPNGSGGFRIIPDSGTFFTITGISLFLTGLGTFYILNKPVSADKMNYTAEKITLNKQMVADVPAATPDQKNTPSSDVNSDIQNKNIPQNTVPLKINNFNPVTPKNNVTAQNNNPLNSNTTTIDKKNPVNSNADFDNPVAALNTNGNSASLNSSDNSNTTQNSNAAFLLNKSNSGINSLPVENAFSYATEPLNKMSAKYPSFGFEYPSSLNPSTTNSYRKPSSLLSRFSVGAYFLPEFHYNLNDPKSDFTDVRTTASPLLSLGYDAKNLFVEAGVGINKFSDNVNNHLHYSSIDLVGAYFEVDSIDFDMVWIDSLDCYVPIVDSMYSHQVLLYDKFNHERDEYTKRNFSYIQIPVSVSYRKYFGKFGVSAGAGLNFSILMQKKETTLPVNNEITMISHDKNESALVKTSTQLFGTIGFSYAILPSMNFVIEPQMRYYLKSMYQSDGVKTKTPFSFGIRTGITINL
ncbi:MAG: hypothetical protein V2A54_10995 [Bacteroidota bacterium]